MSVFVAFGIIAGLLVAMAGLAWVGHLLTRWHYRSLYQEAGDRVVASMLEAVSAWSDAEDSFRSAADAFARLEVVVSSHVPSGTALVINPPSMPGFPDVGSRMVVDPATFVKIQGLA